MKGKSGEMILVRKGLRIFRWNVDTAVRHQLLPDLGHAELWLWDTLHSVVRGWIPAEKLPASLRHHVPVVVEEAPAVTFGRVGFSAKAFAEKMRRSGKPKTAAVNSVTQRQVTIVDPLRQKASVDRVIVVKICIICK